MLTIHGELTKTNCTGLPRRDFLMAGTLGLTGFALADLLRSRALAGQSSKRNTAVILFWLDGGLSQFESYDPKPETLFDLRGPYGAIDTNVPGIQISDMLPKHAKVMDKLSILRSVHHKMAGHWGGPHAMLTGFSGPTVDNPTQTNPSAGSIVAKARGANRAGMLPYVGVPFAFNSFEQLAPGYHGSAYLGLKYNPFDVNKARKAAVLNYAFKGGEEFNPRNFQLPDGMTLQRLNDRLSLRQSFDRLRRNLDTSQVSGSMDQFDQQALDITLQAGAREAFDLSKEDPRLRDRYGRNVLGQSALLARRLVEAGVTFVTVCHRDWDHHARLEELTGRDLPKLDSAVSSLTTDLDERGMLDDVLILVMGDFGRTPKFNKMAGRDHWPDAGSVLIGGAGLKGGQVVGATNDKGEYPISRPLSPADVLATLYHTMGIDLKTHYVNHSGRPVPINNGGKVIRELT